MEKRLIYPVGITEATRQAVRFLPLACTDRPADNVTHLLLDVPVRQHDIGETLAALPVNITVIGGNLSIPELEGYRKIDLLQDAEYLAQNAAITAHCAVKLALQNMDMTLAGCPVLILGWGRIGKCLAGLLKGLGADVTVAARKEADRAMLRALGYRSVSPESLSRILHGFRLIYNTVPAKILSESTTYNTDCVKIELASLPGFSGDYIDGRKLPARLAPESVGRLIAKTIVRRI